MRRTPRVGVTSWYRTLETFLGATDMYTIQAPYVVSLRDAGAVPLVLVPVDEEAVVGLLDGMDGLVLSGGSDIEPSRYGAERHPRSQEPDHERDAFEVSLAREAIARGMPVLAICRGMQSLNVALGGTLHQNVVEHVPGAGDHDRTDVHDDVVHEVTLEPDSKLAAIFGARTIQVNSMHHQAVAGVAGRLRVVGRHPASGLAEAAELEGHPWCVAVQWHPEALVRSHSGHGRLFRAFVAAAAEHGDMPSPLG